MTTIQNKVFTFALTLILGAAPANRAAQAQALVEGNTAFGLELYRQLKAHPGNLFVSPYSVSTALAMTYAGARGNTEQQMSRVLHFAKDQTQVHAAFGQLQRQLGKNGQKNGIQFSLANALWAENRYPFLGGFLKIAQGEYEASVKTADFKTAAETARGKINLWVAGKTKNRIQDILPPGSLTEDTRLVLANAIYFKGVWAKPFAKAETSVQPFHLSAARQEDAHLMYQVDDVGYMENADFQAVELPYTGGGLSMVILLPRRVDGCGNLEERLTAPLLADALRHLKRQEVEVFLPRFKLESSFILNNALAKMGMPDAFDDRAADFSGMDGTKNLFISGIYHKAWGEVNEEGTEAAAATVVVTADRAVLEAAPPPRPVFRADHPFIFLIRDSRSGSLLFLGRLADPT